jgi:hypothetical protein
MVQASAQVSVMVFNPMQDIVESLDLHASHLL